MQSPQLSFSMNQRLGVFFGDNLTETHWDVK
jgi:hypothetical protein